MNHKEEMELIYEYFYRDSPKVKNPNLDIRHPQVEQLVRCKCFKSYRVFVNGDHPISDTKMLGIVCPHCGTPASEFISLSGHSAGCFNATISL